MAPYCFLDKNATKVAKQNLPPGSICHHHLVIGSSQPQPPEPTDKDIKPDEPVASG